MPGPLRPDPEAIQQALEVLTEPGQVVEIRALNVRTGSTRFTENQTGYFDTDHLNEAVQAIVKIPEATGIYFLLNPALPDLHARSFNHMKKAEKGGSTADHEIVKRRWLLIDVDAKRPAGISATDAEKEALYALAMEVRAWLTSEGWPAPLVIDSGNGTHLLYRIELPAEDGGLIGRVLVALNLKFGNDVVKIDGVNGNAARISKLPGTPVCKGDSTPTRPHRMSVLLEAPENPQPVPTAFLEALAGVVETKTKPENKATPGGTAPLDAWLAAHALTDGLSDWESWKNGQRRVWDVCPMNPEHTDRSAMLYLGSDGIRGFKCHHDGCKTYHWRDLRAKYDPPSDVNGWYEEEDPGEPPEPAPWPEEAEGSEKEGDSSSEPQKKVSDTTRAMRLVQRTGAETWVDVGGRPHLTVPVGNHIEHYTLRTDPDTPAGQWLARVFYKKYGRAISSSTKKDVLENLAADAGCADRIYPTAHRVAQHEGQVYLDLCNSSWQVVVTQAGKWTVREASQVSVRFTRTPHMQALPLPTRGRKIEDIRPFFNCSDEDFRLIITWTLAALFAGREYPILVLGGEPGSAKSTATTYTRSIIDPNVAPLRKCPKEERDLFIAAGNAFVLTIDNISTFPDWLSDALCALALDIGYACRALYTNDGESVFRVAAPGIMNGISEMLTRSDLADRALSVTLHRISPEAMRPKNEMDAAFQAALPGALGGFLDVLASALERLPHVHLGRYPRLAQTAKLMAAAEPALGWEPGTFAKVFDMAQKSVASNVTEGDALAQALVILAQRVGGHLEFEGTATGLQMKLATVNPNPKPQVWPPAVNKLGERLRRVAPQLRLMGWEIDPDGRDGTHKAARCIRIKSPADSSLGLTVPEDQLSAPQPAPSLDRGQLTVADGSPEDSLGNLWSEKEAS